MAVFLYIFLFEMVLGRADGTRYINENCPHSFAFHFFNAEGFFFFWAPENEKKQLNHSRTSHVRL